MIRCLKHLALTLTLLATAPAFAAGEPTRSVSEAAQPTALNIFPPEIKLATKLAHQSLVVQATFPDGLTRDVTSGAKISLDDPHLASLNDNSLTPLADGKTELKAEFGGKTAK